MSSICCTALGNDRSWILKIYSYLYILEVGNKIFTYIAIEILYKINQNIHCQEGETDIRIRQIPVHKAHGYLFLNREEGKTMIKDL